MQVTPPAFSLLPKRVASRVAARLQGHETSVFHRPVEVTDLLCGLLTSPIVTLPIGVEIADFDFTLKPEIRDFSFSL